VPLGIKFFVNKPLPEFGIEERFTTSCFSSNAMID
jgi:hypothetical protein